MSHAPKGPMPTAAEGVEILKPTRHTAGTPPSEVEITEDERLLSVLERRVGFTPESWEGWRVITLEYCATHHVQAVYAHNVDLAERTLANLYRALQLSERRGS